MVSENTEANIDTIKELIEEAKAHNGQQQSNSINTKLHQIRDKLISLSDGEVDFYFERNNSNPKVGTYRITLKCTDETEAFINGKSTEGQEEEPRT